jgi:hypothetical protein
MRQFARLEGAFDLVIQLAAMDVRAKELGTAVMKKVKPDK